MTPFKAGLLGGVLLLVFTFFGFTKYNPFTHPYVLHATFESANNLQPKSPVREAGVDVGKVTDVQPLKKGNGQARVTMELEKKGLPIHTDAELKIRPRIFLEGNFFVDLQPGTPSTPTIKDGGDVPVQNTSTPVQFGQLLTVLQADTRKNLQIFFKEYAEKGLGNGGAQAYNQGLSSAPEAFRTSAIANQASLGTQPHDLSNLVRGQQRLFAALSTNPGVLQSLIVNLNVTANAFARQEAALSASVPLLRDVLQIGTPALAHLNNALPTLRAFARDALPGTISSLPTINASLPFITQAALLLRPEELQGLAHDLKFTIPDLAKVNHSTIPLLNQQRALSRCQNRVLYPFSIKPIPDPDFPQYPDNNNQPFYKTAPRSLVGLAGESRINDANTPVFHIQFGSGLANVLYTDQSTGQRFFAQSPTRPEGVRPLKPTQPSASGGRPVFRPNIPCETQQVPDMTAAGAAPDQAFTSAGAPLPVPAIGSLHQSQLKNTVDLKAPLVPTLKGAALLKKNGKPDPTAKQVSTETVGFFLTELGSYLDRTSKGESTPSPLMFKPEDYVKELAKVGLATDQDGVIYVKDQAKYDAALKNNGAPPANTNPSPNPSAPAGSSPTSGTTATPTPQKGAKK
ncbi:MAG: MCE family protein [Actinobacteria bacterium]|nr:MCE family protein [Actinomycetota bacterium]